MTKYISTKEAVRLTGLSTQEIYNLIQAQLKHFEKVWNDPDILKSNWKRFAKMANEFKAKIMVEEV